VPWIIMNGGDAFLNLGKPNNGGTKIFSVSGDVARPGNYEVRLGTPFAKLLEMAGGMRDGRKLKAVIPGAPAMPVLPADIMMATDMDYDSIAKAGSMLGSGAVLVMGRDALHGPIPAAAVLFLLRGIVRPVHALPRRDRLAVPDVDRIEHGKGKTKTSIYSTALPTTSRGAPSARSAMRRRCRCARSSSTIETSSSITSTTSSAWFQLHLIMTTSAVLISDSCPPARASGIA
jgi:hypothetical protein